MITFSKSTNFVVEWQDKDGVKQPLPYGWRNKHFCVYVDWNAEVLHSERKQNSENTRMLNIVKVCTHSASEE